VHFEIKGEDWRLFHRRPSSADQEDGEKQRGKQIHTKLTLFYVLNRSGKEKNGKHWVRVYSTET